MKTMLCKSQVLSAHENAPFRKTKKNK